MIRLNMIVEGQTEEAFVNQVLVDHLGHFGISTSARCVETGRKKKRIFRGGVSNYQKAKKDISLWMQGDWKPEAFFTTMFDLYALPTDFPGYEDTCNCRDPYQRIEQLEEEFRKDFESTNFIPYIQLHEFEALVLADPSKLLDRFFEKESAIRNLENQCNKFTSPELINDGEETAPSKRIIKEIPEYKGQKVIAGPEAVSKIGLEYLREKCPHFDGWIKKLESLSSKGIS